MAKKSLYLRIAGTLATLGPLGGRLPAPGTWGALAGTVFYWLAFQTTGLNSPGHLRQFLMLAGALTLFAVPVCSAGEKFLGRKDPGEVNFDEFAVMPFCYAGLGPVISRAGTAGQILWLLAGFALFRLFDIAKPFGIKKLQKIPGGAGIVIDDFVAALFTCACLWLARWAYVLTANLSN
ncbi:MAG: phosphatidylglycerophosphatase A [Opitutales bacterium]|nr:phosphatidylglycerophosphatase A [Opitutales bacterium]